MKLRELLEAPGKRAAFALGRMNPATTGHELLVNAIKQAPGDSFLFLTDRAPKLPDNPLTSEEKLDWARKSFDGIAIGLAKTVLTAADRLYKMGYTEVTFLEGEDKLFKLLQQYNGQEKPMHNYNFDKIDYVQLSRNATADDATGMSGTKLRSYVTSNDLESFKKGVTDNAQPYAEEMFMKLSEILGVEPIGENVEIPVVNYDRNYGGDINKVLAVKPNAQADAKKIYQQLGGINQENYKKMQELVQAKIQELRNVYRAANAKEGLKGKDALHSPHYKLFRKQSNDLKIMMSTALEMMQKVVSPNSSSAVSAGGKVYTQGSRGGQMAQQSGFKSNAGSSNKPVRTQSLQSYKQQRGIK